MRTTAGRATQPSMVLPHCWQEAWPHTPDRGQRSRLPCPPTQGCHPYHPGVVSLYLADEVTVGAKGSPPGGGEEALSWRQI